MKWNGLTYVFLALLLSACSQAPGNKKNHQTKIEPQAIPVKKPSGSFNDTLKITSPAAVFFQPDSLQLQKIKSVTAPNTFEATMHEDFYLLRNAHIVLKKYYPHLKIIEAHNVRYLLFIKADKSVECTDLDTKAAFSGLFIFSPKKLPELVDMANIDSELGFYFSK